MSAALRTCLSCLYWCLTSMSMILMPLSGALTSMPTCSCSCLLLDGLAYRDTIPHQHVHMKECIEMLQANLGEDATTDKERSKSA